MNSDAELRETLRGLFRSQNLAILATDGAGQPHTSRDTRKYANLAADGRVSVLIDNRPLFSVELFRANNG